MGIRCQSNIRSVFESLLSIVLSQLPKKFLPGLYNNLMQFGIVVDILIIYMLEDSIVEFLDCVKENFMG